VLSESEIGLFYLDNPIRIPHFWNLGRKHIRVSLKDGRFVKLNLFENRLNERDLRFYCFKLRPMHVYFSVLNWLFPERVGKKYKARYDVPLNGEYVIDIDSYLMLFKHNHKVDDHWFVCEQCLDMARRMTLQLCEVIQKYYAKIAIVFSGRAGFHVRARPRLNTQCVLMVRQTSILK